MSFMPNPGSVVKLRDGRIAIITSVTPDGSNDRMWNGQREERVVDHDIWQIIHEPELPPRTSR